MGKVTIDDDYTYKGYRLVIIENDYLKIVVLPEKGADIYQFLDKKNNIDFLWKTPMGLREKVKDIPAGYGNESNFTDSYEGGWQMVFPNGGSSCCYKGVNLEMCGDAQTCSWKYRIIKNGPDCVKVAFETETHRLPFKLQRIMEVRKDESVMKMKEIIQNNSNEPMEYMWGQHIAFEGDLIRDGNWQIRVPCYKVYTNTGALAEQTKPPAGNRKCRLPSNGEFTWPKVTGADGSLVDLSLIPREEDQSCDIAYLHELSKGWYALVNETEELAFHFSWPEEVFPYVWYYQNFKGSFGYPWYGRGNGIALEPITSYPALGLQEAILRENHRVIEAREEIKADFSARVIHGRDQINKYTNGRNQI